MADKRIIDLTVWDEQEPGKIAMDGDGWPEAVHVTLSTLGSTIITAGATTIANIVHQSGDAFVAKQTIDSIQAGNDAFDIIVPTGGFFGLSIWEGEIGQASFRVRGDGRIFTNQVHPDPPNFMQPCHRLPLYDADGVLIGHVPVYEEEA